MMRYHITYTNRTTGKTETGLVFVDRTGKGAAEDRAAAIRAAYFKYYNARLTTIRAVRVSS